MSQLTLQEFLKSRQWCFDLTSNLSEEDREDQNLPLTVEEVNIMQMAMFVDVIASETHSSFMHNYPNFTHTNLDPDTFHDIQLACKRVKKENECCHQVKALSLKNNWKIWKASKKFPSGQILFHCVMC